MTQNVRCVDGARLMNAVVARGPQPSAALEWDSVAIVFRGWAPMGSMLVGSTDFMLLTPVAENVRWRHAPGGDRRCAGLHALVVTSIGWPRIVPRRRIAEALDDHPRGIVNLDGVETSMVYFGIETWTGQQTLEHLAAHGIDVLTNEACRMVLHLHVTDEDVNQVFG